VSITEDAEMSKLAPRKRPARVTLTLKDGRTATVSVESHRGDFDAPFDRQELLEKFRELASHVLTGEGVRHAEAMLLAMDEVADFRGAIDALRGYVRPG